MESISFAQVSGIIHFPWNFLLWAASKKVLTINFIFWMLILISLWEQYHKWYFIVVDFPAARTLNSPIMLFCQAGAWQWCCSWQQSTSQLINRLTLFRLMSFTYLLSMPLARATDVAPLLKERPTPNCSVMSTSGVMTIGSLACSSSSLSMKPASYSKDLAISPVLSQ